MRGRDYNRFRGGESIQEGRIIHAAQMEVFRIHIKRMTNRIRIWSFFDLILGS